MNKTLAFGALALAVAMLCGCGSEKPAATPPNGGAARQKTAAPATPQPSPAGSNVTTGADSPLLKPGSVAAWQELLGKHLPAGWRVEQVNAVGAPPTWKRTAGSAGVAVRLAGPGKDSKPANTTYFLMPPDWEGDAPEVELGKGDKIRGGKYLAVPRDPNKIPDIPIPLSGNYGCLGRTGCGHLFVSWVVPHDELNRSLYAALALQHVLEPSWGQPVGGVRLGLFPRETLMGEKNTDLRLLVSFENVGKEPVEVPVHNTPGLNAYRLMFGGEKDGKVFCVVALMERTKVLPPGRKMLQPGERFSEEILLSVPGANEVLNTPNPLVLPSLNPGESLTLRAGISPRIDPRGEKEWNDPATLKSGTVTIRRAAANANPMPAGPAKPEPAAKLNFARRTLSSTFVLGGG